MICSHYTLILLDPELETKSLCCCKLLVPVLFLSPSIHSFLKLTSRMRGPSQLKHEFMRKWAKVLQIYSYSNKDMSFLERKKAINLSADVAMASTRSTTTRWGRALIAEASKNHTTKVVVEHVLGHDENITNNNVGRLKKSSAMCSTNKKVRFKKILRKSCALGRLRETEPPKVLATCVAKRMVKKRTQMLKNLVPGGKLMDDVSIIQEALDYIISLRVQVKVMRHLAKISELVNHRDKAVTS